MTEIIKPIQIVCTGRSGSTMYYRMIARHKDVGWLSTLNQAFPSQVWLSAFAELYRWPIFNRIRDHRYFPKPFSPYHFWQQWLPDIARHDRPLYPEDVPESAIEPIRNTIARVLWLQRKSRFVFKVTGWARMAYFQRIFPDLRFIYIMRNPVDVVSSWIRVGRLNVTAAVDSPEWEWGEVPESHFRVWRDMGGGPLLSAAMKTQLDIDDIRRNIAMFPGRCYELRYEDLVRDPHRYMRETLEFCELEWYDGFEKVIQTTAVLNLENKWKKHLTEEQGRLLHEFFERVNQAKAVA